MKYPANLKASEKYSILPVTKNLCSTTKDDELRTFSENVSEEKDSLDSDKNRTFSDTRKSEETPITIEKDLYGTGYIFSLTEYYKVRGLRFLDPINVGVKLKGHHRIRCIINSIKRLDPHTPSNIKKALSYLKRKYGSKIWERWDKLMFKYYILPFIEVKDMIYRCRTFGDRTNTRVLHGILALLWSNKELYDTLIQDGLKNIVPLCIKLQRSPRELKKELGKGTWKSICKNSFTRNLLIASHCLCFSSHITPREHISALNKIPSTLLKKTSIGHHNVSCITVLLKSYKGRTLKSITPREVQRDGNIIRDTATMALRLGLPFNEEWSLKKIKKKHEEYNKLILEQKYSKDKFILKPRTIREFSYGGYTATILDSPYLMAEEGRTMKHCIGSYVESARKEISYFYSIKDKEGNRVSSLQINPKTGKIGQHYGPCNSYVKDDRVSALAFKLGELIKKESFRDAMVRW